MGRVYPDLTLDMQRSTRHTFSAHPVVGSICPSRRETLEQPCLHNARAYTVRFKCPSIGACPERGPTVVRH